MKKLALIITLISATLVYAEDEAPKQPITYDELKAKVEASKSESRQVWLDAIRAMSREEIQEQKKKATQAMTFYCSSAITNLTVDLAIAAADQSGVSEESIEIFLERCGWMLE